MAKGKETPSLDKWLRTFKTVGKGVGTVARGVLDSAAPSITSSADSIVEASREAQSAYNDARYKVKNQINALNRTIAGKNAQTILNDAYNDIKNGTFSLNKFADSSYDAIDDFDSYIDEISVDANDPDSVALGESKKNMAILGRTVAEGNAATIEGMRNMTATISNVYIKSSQASSAKMANVILTGVNQISTQLSGVNGRLDTINKNIVSILDFQRNNAAVTNQAAIEYYSESSRMLNEMGAVVSELKDFMENQRSIERKKSRLEEETFDMSGGFNFDTYKELVKHNYKNSSIGQALGMLQMMTSMTSMGSSMGMSPFEMVMSMAGSKLLPKNIRKSTERLDKIFSNSVEELLYRIGDMRYDTSNSLLKPIIGTLLGKKRESFSSARMGDFKKDAMSWNGIAQKTLVEVIPSYLARIESKITKGEERYYNMDTGRFMTRSKIQDKYQSAYQSNVEFDMREFTKDLNEAFKKSNISEDLANSLFSKINDITDKSITGEGNAKDLNRELYSSLKGNVSDNELRDLMMSFSENITSVKRTLSEFNKSVEESISGSIYRNLFNEDKTFEDYHKSANINSGVKYSKSGKRMEDLTEEELRELEADEFLDKKYKKFKEKFGNKFKSKKKSSKPNFDKRMASHIDNFTNFMYDSVYGYSDLNNKKKKKSNTASTRDLNLKANRERYEQATFDEKQTSNINKAQKEMLKESYEDVLNANEDEIKAEGAKIDAIMDRSNKSKDNESSLKALVLGLYTKFLKPLSASIFGKNSIFHKVGENKLVKKLKTALFDENDGIFGGITSYFKDQMDYVKYIFTGKGYTNRSGEVFKDNEDSVFGHFSKGYDSVFKHTMTYLFGEDYSENEKYQKYFSWLDFKNRKERKKKKQEEDETKTQTVSSTITTPIKEHVGIEDKSNTAIIVRDNLVEASEEASFQLVEATNQLSTEVLGTEEGLAEVKKQTTESITSKIKKHLPKLFTAGTAGAIVGASTGIHGAGILGSLFLPGGPISGAILGMGLSIASRSKSFQEFLFGKEGADGKKTNGLISNKMQEFVKNNKSLIIGAGAVGAVTGVLKSVVGMSTVGGPGGFLLNTLLPGGAIGGAVLGLSVALLRNNKKFTNILFGEKADEEGDNTRKGGLFSKGYNNLHKVFEKSGNFFKGGLKGLGIGALSAMTISKMGILGSAVTLGGPIGWGLAGLGLGIAGQTKKFQELLFGTEEFDENGNLKGRAGDGILTRMKNMLVVDVFEPIKDKIQANTEDFAFWLKKNITYPFRLAFGPIADSMKTIKTDITDVVHEVFNNVAESVGDAIKKGLKSVFAPFTKVLKIAGEGLAKTMTVGAKFALSPISVPLKLLSWTTRKARRKARGEETKSIIENFGDILSGVRSNWATEDIDNAESYKGFTGKINKFLTHGRDIIGGIDAARLGYEQGQTDTGYNSFNWMNVKAERAADKVDISNLKKNRKQWKKIDEYRRQINKEVGHADINFTDEENEKIRKKLYKMGIDKDWIASDDDLRLFFKNKTDWKDKFDPTKNSKIEDLAKNGIKLNETGEQAQARRNTAEYQKNVIARFDTIVKQFTAMGVKNGLKKKKNLSLDSVKEIDANLKEQGLTWEDVGIDPSHLMDASKVDDETWEDFMREKFVNGEVTNAKSSFSKTIRDRLDRENQLRDILNKENDKAVFTNSTEDVNYLKKAFSEGGFSYEFATIKDLIEWLDGHISTPLKDKIKDDKESNEAQVEALEDIKSSTTTSANLDINESMIEDGATRTDIYKSTGRKVTTKMRSVFEAAKRKLRKQEKESKEEEKDKYLRGSISSQDGKLTYEEAVIDAMDEEGAESKKKGTVFDIVKGGVKGFLGSIFNIITGSSFWTKVGIGIGLTGLYGGKVKEFFDPILSKVGKFMEEKGLPFLANMALKTADFITENLPSLIERYTENIVNNMGTIIESTAKIVWSGLETMVKMLVNKLSISLGGNNVFEVNGVKKSKGTTYNSYEEAVAEAGEDANLHMNTNGTVTDMGSMTDIDSEGNAYNVGKSSFKKSLAREAIQFVRSPLNRQMAKSTVKGVAKIAGWATGIIPGFRLGKKIVGGAASLGKGAYSAGKAGINALKNTGEKAAKEGAEALIETNVEKAAKTVAKEGAEAVTDSNVAKKGIKLFLEKAANIIKKGASLVADKIPANKFTRAIGEMIKFVSEKVGKASSAMLQKISDHITAKSAKAAGRTAATVTPIGLGFAVFDALNGALKASYLFGVNDSDVTARMRLVSSIMEVLLGTGPGAWIDIVLEIIAMFGFNGKQKLARCLYVALGGDSDYLEKSITELELETKKYNEANGTNLSVDAYNEKKNSSNGIFGRVSKLWTKLTNKEKYKEKYDYSAYEVSEAEIADYLKQSNAENAAMYDYSVYDENAYNSYYQNTRDYTGSDVTWGPGRYKRAVGYGSLQSDSRWADYKLGRFPDGTTSTMSTGGCGPTALSMIANSFGNTASPLAVAQYAKNNGYIKDGGATAGLFTDGASRLGLNSKTVSSSSVKDALANGQPVIVSGKSYNSSSPYTQAGHVVMAQGLNNGYVKVNDPMRGDTIVKLSDLTSGMTNGWSYSSAIGYGSASLLNDVTGTTSNKASLYSDATGHSVKEVVNTSTKDIINQLNTINSTNIFAGSKWRNQYEVNNFVKLGYNKTTNGKYKWNNASFYAGLKVKDIRILAVYAKQLLTDSKVPVFKLVYDKFVTSGKYVDTYTLTIRDVQSLINGDKTVKSAIETISSKSTTDTSNALATSNIVNNTSSGESKGLMGILGDIISKFSQIASNMIDSVVTGEDYVSIFADEDAEYAANHLTTLQSDKKKNTTVLPYQQDIQNKNTILYSGLNQKTLDVVNDERWNVFKNLDKDNNILRDSSKTTTGSTPLAGVSNTLSKLTSGGHQLNLTNGTRGSNVRPSYGIGNGRKDFAIGYGLSDSFSNLMNNIGAISYANQASMLGEDYETAKQYYLNNLTSQSSDGTTSLGTNVGFNTTANSNGSVKSVPDGYGHIHSYMGWDMITSQTSNQMKLKKAVESYDSDGFGMVGDRYAVAVKPYYGSVGDYLNVYQKDGSMYKVAVADIKGNENGSTGNAQYVHSDGSVVEFVVNKNSWYGTNKAVVQFHPEWNQDISRIENVGNYWNNDAGDKVSYGLGRFKGSRAVGYGYSWLQIVQAVKSALANRKLGYSQSRYIALNVLGTTLPNVRTDCSGFVSACLRLYGSYGSNTTSRGFVSMNSLSGFTKGAWTGWDSLQAGDIIARDGHVEIFAKNEGGKHYVFNCGSDSSCNNPGLTTDSGKSYTVVWRPNEAGNIASLNGMMNSDGTTSVAISAMSPISELFSSIKTIATSALGFGVGSSRNPAGYFTRTLNGHITSGYGQRNSAFGNEFHRGLDIASNKGTAVTSPIDGYVVSTGNDVAGYGNYAVVQSADGNNHLFAHLNKPVGFGVGTKINKNDIIGEVGSSGKSTGDHLHYEIRRDGNKYSTINPMNYKYDKDISKNLNINNSRTSSNGIGSGSKDLSTNEITNKLNVALKTDNVEKKLDSLIEVMKNWAERDAKASSTTQNNTNITTNNIAYGSGKQKKTTTSSKSSKNLTSQNLISIHNAIAAKA